MKTKQIPLIMMLLAGAVTSISTKLMRYELETALWILLGVLIVFYIAGCLIKHTLDSFVTAQEEGGNVSDEGEVIEKEIEENTEETEDVQE